MQTLTVSETSKNTSAVTRKSQQQSFFTPARIQPKLTIGAADDPYEREADAMADRIMRMPAQQQNTSVSDIAKTSFFSPKPVTTFNVQRECASCEKEKLELKEENPDEAEKLIHRKEKNFAGGLNNVENTLQRKYAECDNKEKLHLKHEGGSSAGIEAPSIVEDVINSGGQALDKGARNFFEPRFGHDFSNVKIHTGSKAEESSHAINAHAYTSGNNIVFNTGKYAPETEDGKKLLGHELTHVIQQSADTATVQCDLIDDLRAAAEAAATARLNTLANKPVSTPGTFTGHAGCHANFCQPFPSMGVAVADLAWAGPLILAGIATRVNPRVVPLWASYISGGSAPQNLSANFGADFTNSSTTADTTRFLIGELRRDIETNRTALLGGLSVTTIDFTPRLSSALAEIDDPLGANQMNFNIPADIAGNIAGGIGKDETTFPIGARPSPFNDSREAVIHATLTVNADGSLSVTPLITFKVSDTIDLCPGDCGTPAEQVATVPLSRFEATGLTGDIPMIIEFNAPASELLPFTIAAPVAPVAPITGRVTASSLNIRSTPDTSSAPIGSYPNNTLVTVQCQTTGATIDGNNIWYRTDIGFVSARYILLSGAAVPAPC